MMQASEIPPRSADLSLRRRSTNLQLRDCVTIGSTSQHFAHPRVPRCYRDGIIMRWVSDRLLKSLAVGPGTARIGPPARHLSPKFFDLTATTLLRSANGISRLTTNRDQLGRLTVGRTRSASIIFGAFSAAKPASSIRC